MGCGAAKATAATAPEDAPEDQPTDNAVDGEGDNGKPVGKPVAFEIPIDEEQSIIKKHPPKRLQLLEEQSQNIILSTKDLEEKQTKAEERRQEILQERVTNAQKFQRTGLPKGEGATTPNGLDQEEEEEEAES